VERLKESFQTLLLNHQALKAQNDEVLVRAGLEQQFTLNPVLKGKQMEEDETRGSIGGHRADFEEDDSRETVGLLGSRRR